MKRDSGVAVASGSGRAAGRNTAEKSVQDLSAQSFAGSTGVISADMWSSFIVSSTGLAGAEPISHAASVPAVQQSATERFTSAASDARAALNNLRSAVERKFSRPGERETAEVAAFARETYLKAVEDASTGLEKMSAAALQIASLRDEYPPDLTPEERKVFESELKGAYEEVKGQGQQLTSEAAERRLPGNLKTAVGKFLEMSGRLADLVDQTNGELTKELSLLEERSALVKKYMAEPKVYYAFADPYSLESVFGPADLPKPGGWRERHAAKAGAEADEKDNVIESDTPDPGSSDTVITSPSTALTVIENKRESAPEPAQESEPEKAPAAADSEQVQEASEPLPAPEQAASSAPEAEKETPAQSADTAPAVPEQAKRESNPKTDEGEAVSFIAAAGVPEPVQEKGETAGAGPSGSSPAEETGSAQSAPKQTAAPTPEAVKEAATQDSGKAEAKPKSELAERFLRGDKVTLPPDIANSVWQTAEVWISNDKVFVTLTAHDNARAEFKLPASKKSLDSLIERLAELRLKDGVPDLNSRELPLRESLLADYLLRHSQSLSLSGAVVRDQNWSDLSRLKNIACEDTEFNNVDMKGMTLEIRGRFRIRACDLRYSDMTIIKEGKGAGFSISDKQNKWGAVLRGYIGNSALSGDLTRTDISDLRTDSLKRVSSFGLLTSFADEWKSRSGIRKAVAFVAGPWNYLLGKTFDANDEAVANQFSGAVFELKGGREKDFANYRALEKHSHPADEQTVSRILASRVRSFREIVNDFDRLGAQSGTKLSDLGPNGIEIVRPNGDKIVIKRHAKSDNYCTIEQFRFTPAEGEGGAGKLVAAADDKYKGRKVNVDDLMSIMRKWSASRQLLTFANGEGLPQGRFVVAGRRPSGHVAP